MSANDTSTPLRIVSAVITSPYMLDELDITSVVGGVELKESLDNPYIVGSIAILDDSGLYERMNFRGSTFLRLVIDGGDDTEPYIDRTFVMTKLVSAQQAGDRSSTLVFRLVDLHYYNNPIKRFSRSYTGTPYGVINRIVTDETLMNLGFVSKYLSNDPIQSTMTVIIPYLTPIGAVKWLIKKCTTENGTPYFLWADVFGTTFNGNEPGKNYLRCESLDDMLKQTPFNVNPAYPRASFISSRTMAQNDENNWLSVDERIIEQYNFSNLQDNLELLSSGAVGSRISNTDIGTNLTSDSKYNVKNFLDRLAREDVIETWGNFSKQNVVDTASLLENIPYQEYDSRYFHQISMKKVYGDNPSYFDEPTKEMFKHRLERKNMHHILSKNMMACRMHPAAFLKQLSCIGNIAHFTFTSNRSDLNNPDVGELIDRERSGEYLIMGATYTIMIDKKPIVDLTCTKLEKDWTYG